MHPPRLESGAKSWISYDRRSVEEVSMIRRSSLWIGSVLLLTSLTGYAGGPPILTTSKVPDYFVVGRPETLVFVVRAFCCGHPPSVFPDYRLRATAPGLQKIDVSAIP